MIDPRDFINDKPDVAKPEPENEDIEVSGSFVCGECFAQVNSAYLNEDDMTLNYVCLDGHKNTATL